MRLFGYISSVWKFLRDYALPLLLLGIFVTTLVEVYFTGVGPTPQQPPEGHELQRLEAKLTWHKGNRDGAMTLEVSVDDPAFKERFVDRQISGTSHTLRNLKPGHTYYWRLKRDDDYTRTRSFRTSEHAITF